jgi:hypothetical protein
VFPSAQAKIARARVLIDSLNDEVDSFRNNRPYSIAEHDDEETGTRYAILTVREVPLTLSARIGEILYDLRSALDHVVTDLTVTHNGQELPGTEFPVYADRDLYFERVKRGNRSGKPTRRSGIYKIRGLADDHQDTIHKLQPFEFTATGSITRLQILQDLSNIDKHRRLHLCSVGVGKGGWIVRRDIQPLYLGLPLPYLQDGAELGRWRRVGVPSDDGPDVEFPFDVVVAFAADTPHVPGLSVVELCEKLLVDVERVLHYLGSL